jgi:hypothetical protein
MISIYSYIPNETNSFDFIDSFCSFGNDVALTVSNKLLEDKIQSYTYTNLQVQYIDSQNLSKTHNAALLLTKNPIKICLQPNEYIPTENKALWYDLASILAKDKVDAYAIPLFDADMKYITSKWFMHKDSCLRGKPIDVPETYEAYADGMDLISVDTQDIVSFRATPIDLNDITRNQFPFVLQN